MHAATPVISIIVVNYKVAHEICQLMHSLREAALFDQSEIIVVDNASNDGSQESITSQFPEVHWIGLKTNIGFGKACNVGSQKSCGKYLLFLNPDTLIAHNTLEISLAFMESHPDVGIFGPKIIKPDGTFQHHCRRSFSTPLNILAYLLKLHKLFPKNPHFGQYIYSTVSPEISMEVDAVSGSYLFMRAGLFKQLGGFDEAFFMYGEDLDLCARCKEAGFKVWYHPQTQIIHFKGKSGAKNFIRTRIAFYEAWIIFAKKYQHSYGGFLPGWMITIGAKTLAMLSIMAILLRSFTALIIDLSVINLVLWIAISLRFTAEHTSPYTSVTVPLMVLLHTLLSGCFILVYSYQGIYLSERYSSRNVLLSSAVASIFFLTSVFFIKAIAFSRIAFAVSVVAISFLLFGWRKVLPLIIKNMKRNIYSTGNVIIIGGDNAIMKALLKEIEQDKNARICGIIWSDPTTHSHPGEFSGYPVFGTLSSLGTILIKQRINLLIVATRASWYSSIIEALTFSHLKHLTIRWVAPELFKKPVHELPNPIPLNDFSV